MARPTSDTLTEREAHIMGVLWDLGTATAEEVREALPDHPHDSSVRTLLRVLETKSYVRHEIVGRKYVYQAAVHKTEAQRAAVRSLLARLFDGAAEELVVQLIEDDQIGLGAWEKLKRAHRDYGKRLPKLPPRRTKKSGRRRG